MSSIGDRQLAPKESNFKFKTMAENSRFAYVFIRFFKSRLRVVDS